MVKASTGGAFSSGVARVRPSWSRSRFSDCCTWPAPASSAAASSSRRIFFERGLLHWFPCAVASSRRLNSAMPIRPMMPPSSSTICPNAAPSSPQVMLRPVLSESIGEKFFARLMTSRMPLNSRNQHHVRRRMPRDAGLRIARPIDAPRHRVGHRPAGETPGSGRPARRTPPPETTGSWPPPARAPPAGPSSRKMMPSPRAKFSPKPPSGYSTSMPSSSGNSSVVLLALTKGNRQHALVVEKIGRDFEIHERCPAPGSSARCARHCVLRGTPTCHSPSNVPDALPLARR